ncbi:serine hydrolase domain-containing protein, partial [Lutimonas sp.]|uniref:serine hydrolase domain-containing protein n=1 Tax=Lutimonas sp. TaxID=1872403 RepID=UPI003D9AD96C
RDGAVVHEAAYGYKDVTSKSILKVNDIFYIQSMTKPIVSVAFMMLYEQGHFSLSDPLAKYLPEFKNLKVIENVETGITGNTVALEKDITILELLTHTSGFTHAIGESRFDKEVQKEYYMKNWPDINSQVNSIPDLPLMAQPGQAWNYSFSPDILSVLIEHFSGMSTLEYLTKNIFEPLDMKDTGYNLSKDQQSRVVKAHVKDSIGILGHLENQAKVEGNTIWSGTHGLFSTPQDYMNFCQMLLNNGSWNGHHLLSRKTIELMTANHVGNLFFRPGEGFGLGFAVITDTPATNQLGSDGVFYWAGAYNTHFFIDPHEKLISIFMTQLAPFTFYYHDKMRQLVYPAIID